MTKTLRQPKATAFRTRPAHPQLKLVPVAFASMPDDVLSGLPIYLRSLDAAGTETFRLYAGADVQFTADHRRKLLELKTTFIHIPAEDQPRLRRQLESRMELVAQDSSLNLAVRCDIIYEATLGLVDEALTGGKLAAAVPRLMHAARTIINLHLAEPRAFACFYSGAHHDAYAATHAANVAAWIPALAGALGEKNPDTLQNLCMGALLYDLGMTLLPVTIQNHKNKLNTSQLQQMRQHPELAAQLLRETPQIDPLIPTLALQHHERLDGSGYPHRLTFDRIHYASRMIAVLDVFDALTSFRPYRVPPLSPDTALRSLRSQTPSRFDPQIVGAWINLLVDACPDLEVVLRPNADSGPGRRRFPRHQVNCPTTLKRLTLVGGMWAEKETLNAVIHNLSCGGLGLLSRTRLIPGQYHRARFQDNQRAQPPLAVLVVRDRDCGDGWFEAGCRFVDLAQEASPLPKGDVTAPVQFPAEPPPHPPHP